MAESRTALTRDTRRDRVRDELVEIARAIVLEGGADALSVREVARRAGYAPGALYTYFPGKDGLVAALGRDATAELSRYLGSVDPSLPPRPRLDLLVERYLMFTAEQPARYASVFSSLRLPQSSWTEFVAVGDPFTRIVSAFSDGVAQGVFIESEGRGPDAMAFGLWALLHGAATLRAGLLHDMGGQLDVPTTTAVAAYLDGLSAATPHTRLKGALR